MENEAGKKSSELYAVVESEAPRCLLCLISCSALDVASMDTMITQIDREIIQNIHRRQYMLGVNNKLYYFMYLQQIRFFYLLSLEN